MADLEGSNDSVNGSESTQTSLWTRAGVVLLGISVLHWVPLPVVPFLPLSIGAKGALATGLVVTAEIAFWTGAAMAGPEAVKRLRTWMRGTFKRRT